MKQKFLLNAFMLLLFLATGSMAIAQPTWTYSVTSGNHTILLDGSITINGTPIDNGDYVGVFYDDAGVMKCGGYIIWAGSMTALSAWGNDTGTDPVKDGFADNETINWKVWRASDGAEVDMTASWSFGLSTYGTNNTSGAGNLTGTAAVTGLTASGTATDIVCYGQCTGAIDLSVSGGTAPYAFAWSDGSTTEDLGNLCSGEYDVTVSDASGGGSLTMPWNYSITAGNHTLLLQAGVITVNGSALDVGDYVGVFYDSLGTLACGGYVEWQGTTTAVSAWGADVGADGFANNEAFTFRVWRSVDGAEVDMTATYAGSSTYATNATTVVLSMVGTYVPSTASTVNLSFTIVSPDSIEATAVISDYSGYSVSVNGATDGSIDLSVIGGTAPYTYQWSNGAATEDLALIGAGAYDVTVLDANGCTMTTGFILTEPAAANPFTGSGVTTDLSCNGVCDGTVDLTVTGGTPPYTYVWSDGSTTEDLNGLCAGQYDVTITDANATTLAMPWNYTITAGNHTLLVQAGIATVNGSALDVGDYIGVFYDSLGTLACGGYVEWLGTTTAVSAWGADAGADGFANNEAFTFKVWRAADGAEVDMTAAYAGSSTYATNATTVLLSLVGTYVPPAGSAAINLSFTIAEPAALVVAGTSSNPTCFGGADGAIDFSVTGGTAPYTYLWSNAATTEDISGLTAGTYDVVVTDANGCTGTASFSLVSPTEMVVAASVTDVTCNGGVDGLIDLDITGGTAPYTYLWSNAATTQDITAAAGSYDYTVTDANACMVTGTATIAEPAALMVTGVVTNVLCNGDMTGAVDITVAGGTGAYSFAWSNAASTEDIAALMAGIYDVTVMDANGCSATDSYTITEPAALVTSISGANPLCFGGSGSIDLTVSGGTAGYTYLWSDGSTSEDINDAAAGMYSVTVTDANGCTATGFDELFEPTVLAATAMATDVTCNGAADGAIDLTVSGGTTPYTYMWDNSATTEDITAIGGGVYAYTVTDANGCTDLGTATVIEPDVLAYTSVLSDYSGYNVSAYGAADGSIDLTLTGGTAPFTYMWNNGANTEDISGLIAGTTYDFTATDANGCMVSGSFILDEPAAPTIAVSYLVTDVTCFGGADGAIDLTVIDGTAPFTYAWATGETTEDLSGLMAGTYMVTVTDINSETATASIDVMDGVVVTADLGNDMTICDGDVYTLDAGVFASYMWTGGEITQTIDVMLAGTYGVTVTDANGCIGSDDFMLTVDPVFNTTDVATICDGETFMFGTQSLTMAGSYTEVFTAANGCDSTVVLDLTVNPIYNETDMATICDGETFMFGTQTLTMAGSYTEVFTAANGCDSTVVLDLMVNPVYNENAIATMCEGETWIFGTQSLTAAGTYTEVFASVDGCDSTVVLDLMVNPVYNETDMATICDGETFTFGTQSLMTAGTYTEVFASVDGCDSTVVLTLNVNPIYNTTDAATICAGESFVFGTQTLTDAGTYTEVFASVDGCDSTVVLDLIVNPEPFVSFGFNGIEAAIGDDWTYCANENILVDIFNYYGGTAPYEIGFEVNGPTSWSDTLTNVMIGTELFNGMLDAGSYAVAVTYLKDANGCMASMANLALLATTITVNPTYSTTDMVAICDGETYMFGTQSLMVAGQYTEVFQSADGCDSTVVLDLMVNPVYNVTDAMVICEGDSYMFGTQTLTVAGQYTEVFMTVDGCDSTVVLDLMVNPTYMMNETAAICEGDTYIFGTQTLSMSGQYTEVFMTVDGCDSTVVLDLTVNALPVADLGVDVAICEGAVLTLDAGVFSAYLWSNAATTQMIDATASGTYAVTVTDANGCMGSDEMMLTVNALPVVDLGADVEMYDGDVTVLDAGVFSTYMWSTGETTQTISVAAEGLVSVTVTDANTCTGSDDVEIMIIPELTDIDLVQSTDMTLWTAVAGDFATGFQVELDPAVPYYYINAENPVVTSTIAAGMYPFYFSSTPTDFFTYWAGRGVDGTVTGSWEDQMWLIINANAPLFYYKVDASGVITLVDGLQYDFAGVETNLALNGDYLTGDYTFTGMLTGVNGVDSDPVVVMVNFSAEAAAIQAAIDGTIVTMPATVSELYMAPVVFDINVDYPTPFSPDLPADLLVDAYLEFATPLTSGAVIDVQYNGTAVGSYTSNGTETALWLSEALLLPRAVLMNEADAIWTITVTGLMPAMYNLDVTSVAATAVGFVNPANWYVLDEASTMIDVYTVAPSITAMTPADQTLLAAWTTLTITVDNPDDDLTHLEVDVTKVGVTGTGASGQWIQFSIPTDQAQLTQINAAYAGIAQLAYANGVFTIDINTEATPNPFLDFPGWGDGEYIFWYVAYDEYGNQSGYWGDPLNPVDNITYFIETIYDEQFVSLPAGYSLISTYINPANPNASDVFAQISSQVHLVKDENGNPYWPAFGLNNVGNLTIGEAYLVNMFTAQTLLVQGTQIVPEANSIFLPTGWSLFGYLRTAPASIVTMMSGVASDVIVVKTGTGGVYWPAFNFNSIGDLTPGVGYKVRMAADNYLTYPANTVASNKSNVVVPTNAVYTDIKNTGHNMTLGLPEYVWTSAPSIGDEIGVYTNAGLLVGAAVYQGGYVGATVWGNDDLTSNVDGLVEGEALTIKLYRTAQKVEESFEVSAWADGTGLYSDDAVAVAAKLETITEAGSITLGQNTPNPANDVTEVSFFLPQDENVTIEIYNILGEKLENVVSSKFNAGAHTISINVSNYAIGTYMYKLTAGSFESTRKMNVVR